MADSKRPRIWVPIGMKHLFASAHDDDPQVKRLHEIVEIDATDPGLDEDMMAALRGDYDEDEEAEYGTIHGVFHDSGAAEATSEATRSPAEADDATTDADADARAQRRARFTVIDTGWRP